MTNKEHLFSLPNNELTFFLIMPPVEYNADCWTPAGWVEDGEEAKRITVQWLDAEYQADADVWFDARDWASRKIE